MRLQQLIAILLTTLAIVCPVHAQSDLSVRGVVLDCSNSRPVSDAEIAFDHAPLRVETDGDGGFSVYGLPEGYYTATVSAPAYHARNDVRIRVVPDFAEPITICLEPRIYSASTQTVKAAGRAPTLRRVYIDAGSPEFQSAATLGDLLEEIPELEVSFTGSKSGEAKLSVKGGPSKEVLVLLNGVSINSPITGEADINSVPLNSVSSVEFREGGESAAYGAGAVGGVLSISTSSGTGSDITLDGLTGQYDEMSWGGSANIELGKLASVGATRSGYTASNDFFFDDLKGDTPRRQNADIWRMSENYSTSFDARGWPEIELSLSRFEQRNGIPGFQYQLNPTARKSETRSILSARTRFDRINWYVDARYSYKDFEQGYIDTFSFIETNHEYKNNLHQISTELGASLPHDVSATLGATGAYETFGINNLLEPSLSFKNVVERRLSLLASMRKHTPVTEAPIEARVDVRASLRGDVSSFSGPVYSPSVSGGIGLRKWAIVRMDVSYGKSFRSPLYSSLFWSDGTFAVGNPDLEPERLEQSKAEASLSFPVAGELRISATYTHSAYRDLIYWHRSHDNKFTPRNLSGALVFDRTMRAEWDIDPLNLRISYSNTDQISKNRSWIDVRHDRQLVYRPRYLQHFSARYSNAFVDLEYRMRHSSKRYIRDANTKELPGFTVSDISAGLKFQTSIMSGRLQYDIHNLTNAEYQLIERYPLPGRRWSLTARVTVPIEIN